MLLPVPQLRTERPPSAQRARARAAGDRDSPATTVVSTAQAASHAPSRLPPGSVAPSSVAPVGGRGTRFAEPIPQQDLSVSPTNRGLARSTPEPAQGHNRDNGWQAKHPTVGDRIGSLFNCHNMSDIIFHVGKLQIPAHRCVLGATSPVFYHRLFEAPVKDDGGRCRIWKLNVFHGAGGHVGGDRASPSPSTPRARQVGRESPHYGHSSEVGRSEKHEEENAEAPDATCKKPLEIVIDYPFEAFFEFLRYIYKDELNITLDNVAAIAFLADDFNLPVLSDKCMEFMRSVVSPQTALRVLRVLKVLLCKAVVVLWRDSVESSKILSRFKEFSSAERKKRMEELLGIRSRNGSRLGSRIQSRIGSRSGSRAGSRGPSRPESRRSSAVESDATRGDYGAENEDDAASVGDMVLTQLNLGKNSGDIFKLAEGGKQIHPCVSPIQMSKQFVDIGDLLQKKSWACVRDRTEVVLATQEFYQADRGEMKQILGLEMCSVSEIDMFRALLSWADYHCKKQGLATLPEHRRNIAGKDFIELIRFPVLKPEEFQWEVVPSGLLEYRDIQAIQRKAMNAFVSFSDEPRNLPPSEISKQNEAKRHSLHAQRRTSYGAADAGEGLALREATRRGAGADSPEPHEPGMSDEASVPQSRMVSKSSRAAGSEHHVGISFAAISGDANPFQAGEPISVPTKKTGGMKKAGGMKKGAAAAGPNYARHERLKDDDMDALLSARMWRNHVDELVATQRAQEALDGLDGDPDKRMVFCGEPVDYGRPWSPPQVSDMAEHQRGAGSFLPSPTPMGGWSTATTSAPRSTTAAPSNPTSPVASPSPRSSSSLSHRVKQRPKAEQTMVLKTPSPLTSSARNSDARPKKVSLEELENLTHGFYRFRGDTVIEMRLESGDPVVYEHRPAGPTPDVQESLTGMRETEVRSSLGIRPPSTGSGVPLNDFLSGNI